MSIKWFTSTFTTIFIFVSSPTHAIHAWGNYHWARTTQQFTLKLGNNLTNGWESHLIGASSDWNSPTLVGVASTPLLTVVVAGKSKSNCSMVIGTTQVCNRTYGKNGWLGLATINISGGIHITKGSAKMNDTYFDTAKYNNPNEKRHVMCQEIAHTFGLDHQSEDGTSQDSCMDYFSNTGENATSTLSTKPNAHDFEELGIIYAHLDAITTVAPMSPLAFSEREVTENANGWGQLVSQSRNGRSSKYESVESDGSMKITHVYWTLEAAANCTGCDHRYERHDR